MVVSTEYETVYNYDTQKADFVRSSNFTGENLVMDSYNITDVDCIHFISGGQICDSP